MGRVYLGRSAAGRLVAVKTIRAEFAEEPDFRTRFAHEVAAARRVSGAFTAPVVAADPEADVPWLATAYVPAPPLSTLVGQCGPLPVPAVRWLAAGCAEALESIHGVGLVHRDLKPSNVLVSPDGPRVIDFGVARAAERIQLTLTRGAVGTPAYMAPEQARDTARATTASDVYSLGATILFAATGHGPYRGDSVMDVLVHLATEAPDIAGLPAELIEVVTACLDRDPRRRPTSASVLAHVAPGGAESADGVFARAPLPATALALIEKYRRDPKPSEQPGQGGAEDTFGSYPSQRPAPRSGARHSAGRRLIPSRPSARPRRPRRSPVLTGLAAAVSAVALLGAGVAVGALVARHNPGATGGSASAGISPTTGGTPAGAVTGPPPPFTSPARDPLGKPIAVLNQAFGDPETIFVIQGRDWPPGLPITVRLAGMRASPEHVIVDAGGSFNYAINQNHEFFRFGIPPGRYKVVVTAPNGLRATASFVVRPPGPPGGSGPPPQA
jgi:serine/threonine protein kinase